MGFIIDTCVIINVEKNIHSFRQMVAGYEKEKFYLSVITESELLHGIYRAKNLAVRNKRCSFVENILREFPVLSIDSPIARIHAEIWAELLNSGQMIGAHDLWIAASCMANGYTLITEDKKAFEKVPGLQIL